MKLWLIEQSENRQYDTYDSAVVAAVTEEEARAITPDGQPFGKRYGYSSRASSPERVTAKYIGEAGAVLGSFNAG